MTITHPALDATRRTVTACCRVARSIQRDLERVKAITKDDRSPVTVADYAVQAIVALDLLAVDASALIVGEEHAALLRDPQQAVVRDAVIEAVQRIRPATSADEVLDAIDHCDHDGSAGRYWTLDPVDGTKGFLRGQQYAIALAMIEDGEVTFGIMGCPNLPRNQTAALDHPDETGTLYTATRGGGAWELSGDRETAKPRPIEAAAYEAGAPVRVCESVEAAHSNQSDAARIVEALGSTSHPVRLDSQCKYAVVARGQADAYLRLPTRKAYVEKIWDHAAGYLIAHESGATVSDITGAPLDFGHGARLEANRGVVCAASALHSDLVRMISELGVGKPKG
ncbi:MAG: 3'(2'),5'-bisphosphate nucleotidase [Planctomycetes bacterium]|nr:3'(2'),5'-bisphosphate nucleotidase [Planctomycetota bacterium]